MKTAQDESIQSSLEQVKSGTDFVAAMLYARLFEIDPELSLRFNGNLLEQIRKLLSRPSRRESPQTG